MSEMELVNKLMMLFKVGYSIVCGCVVLLLFIIVACIILRISDKPIDKRRNDVR